jgi:hypothetical protein
MFDSHDDLNNEMRRNGHGNICANAAPNYILRAFYQIIMRLGRTLLIQIELIYYLLFASVFILFGRGGLWVGHRLG